MDRENTNRQNIGNSNQSQRQETTIVNDLATQGIVSATNFDSEAESDSKEDNPSD